MHFPEKKTKNQNKNQKNPTQPGKESFTTSGVALLMISLAFILRSQAHSTSSLFK